MKKILTTIIFLILIVLPGLAQASDIAIDFVPDPLFEETNYLPGDETTGRYALVTNKSGAQQTVYLGLSELISTKEMADVIELSVWESGDELWRGSLVDLYNANTVELSGIGSDDTNQYDFEARMTGSGDGFQQARAEFDLWLGFDQDTKETVSVGSGGGTGFLPTSLQILGERVSDISPVASGFDVTIEWLTNLPANTRVVFGDDSDFPYGLNLSDAELGYENTTEVTNNSPLVTEHLVTLPNLQPGTYYYRVVSRGDTLATSVEHSFILTSSGEIIEETVLGAFDDKTAGGSGIFVTKQSKGSVLGASDVFAHEGEVHESNESSFEYEQKMKEFAYSGLLPGVSKERTEEQNCAELFWFVMAMVSGLTLFWEAWIRKRRGLSRKDIWQGRITFFAGLLVVAIVTLYVKSVHCVLVPLAFVVFMAALANWWARRL